MVGISTDPPPRSVVICGDELGPVIPRTFDPAPGWSPDGHRIKSELDFRPRPGEDLGVRRPAAGGRPGADLLRALPQHRRLAEPAAADRAGNPRGQVYLVADNLSSHTSGPVRAWLDRHTRIHQVFIPVGACWLNLQEGWWRIFRKAALAGQTFADPDEIETATTRATAWLNTRAGPWIWGRPPPPHRRLRRKFTYLL